MRIGIISREFPPDTHVGGIATFSDIAARLLVHHGHEVHVFCNGEKTELRGEGHLWIHRIAMGSHPLPQGRWLYLWRRYARQNLPTWLDAATWAHTVSAYLSHHVEVSRFDAWEWPETNGEGAFLPALPAQSRRICRIHTSWLDQSMRNGLEKKLLLRLQRKSCLKASQVVSPSLAMAENYADRILRLPRPVSASPNPMRMWAEPLNWHAKSPANLLFVGRIEYRKGIDVLVKALEELSTHDFPVTLRVAGAMHKPFSPGDEEVQATFQLAMKRFAAPEQGKVRIEYLGSVPHSQLHEHLDWAGLVVMPSRMDNYPYVLLEALTRGCCLLATQVGGVREICGDQAFAQWIEPDDPAALSLKMRQWLQAETDFPGLWRQAADFASLHFSEEASYQRLMRLYGLATSPSPRLSRN